MPYVLTSFTWCVTWGAPFALIQVGLGRWSVSMVSAVGVAWWGVYQRLTVHSYSYIDPILILSKSLLTLCLILFMTTLSLNSPSEDNPTTLTNKQPDILTILQLSQLIRIIQFIYDNIISDSQWLYMIEGFWSYCVHTYQDRSCSIVPGSLDKSIFDQFLAHVIFLMSR